MVSPINYMLDVKNPIEEAMRGYSLGRQDIEQRQVMQEREQVMGIRGQQEQRAQQQFEAQQAEAARQRAKAQAMQEQLMVLREKAIGGTLTAESLNEFALANASTFDEFRTAFKGMSEPRRQADTQFNLQLSTSLLRGNTESALAMLDTRIAASENAGTEQSLKEAQILRAIRAEAEADPIGFATANLANMTAQGAIDNETMKSLLEASGQTGEATGTFKTLQERAKAAGLVEGTPAYTDFMLRGGRPEDGPLVQNILGDQESEFAKVAGKESATLFSNLTAAGVAASRNLTELENLESVLSQAPTGAGTAFKSYLGQYGINTENLGPIQAAEAAINRLVPAQRPPNSGPMSDADLALFKRSLPSLINQPGGNQLIIDTIRAINQYDIEVSIIAGRALDGVITPAQARQALRELPNPLANFKVPTASAQPENAQPTNAPVVIDNVTIRRID